MAGSSKSNAIPEQAAPVTELQGMTKASESSQDELKMVGVVGKLRNMTRTQDVKEKLGSASNRSRQGPIPLGHTYQHYPRSRQPSLKPQGGISSSPLRLFLVEALREHQRTSQPTLDSVPSQGLRFANGGSFTERKFVDLNSEVTRAHQRKRHPLQETTEMPSAAPKKTTKTFPVVPQVIQESFGTGHQPPSTYPKPSKGRSSTKTTSSLTVPNQVSPPSVARDTESETAAASTASGGALFPMSTPEPVKARLKATPARARPASERFAGPPGGPGLQNGYVPDSKTPVLQPKSPNRKMESTEPLLESRNSMGSSAPGTADRPRPKHTSLPTRSKGLQAADIDMKPPTPIKRNGSSETLHSSHQDRNAKQSTSMHTQSLQMQNAEGKDGSKSASRPEVCLKDQLHLNPLKPSIKGKHSKTLSSTSRNQSTAHNHVSSTTDTTIRKKLDQWRKGSRRTSAMTQKQKPRGWPGNHGSIDPHSSEQANNKLSDQEKKPSTGRGFKISNKSDTDDEANIKSLSLSEHNLHVHIELPSRSEHSTDDSSDGEETVSDEDLDGKSVKSEHSGHDVEDAQRGSNIYDESDNGSDGTSDDEFRSEEHEESENDLSTVSGDGPDDQHDTEPDGEGESESEMKQDSELDNQSDIELKDDQDGELDNRSSTSDDSEPDQDTVEPEDEADDSSNAELEDDHDDELDNRSSTSDNSDPDRYTAEPEDESDDGSNTDPEGSQEHCESESQESDSDSISEQASEPEPDDSD